MQTRSILWLLVPSRLRPALVEASDFLFLINRWSQDFTGGWGFFKAQNQATTGLIHPDVISLFPRITPNYTAATTKGVSVHFQRWWMADLHANADPCPLQNELQMAKLCAIATKLFMERHYTFFDKSLSRTVVIAGSKVSLTGITACLFICHSNKMSRALHLN